MKAKEAYFLNERDSLCTRNFEILTYICQLMYSTYHFAKICIGGHEMDMTGQLHVVAYHTKTLVYICT